ncbi:virulence protein E [Agrobacterium tumefaciens]|nr:virulence protein E [Agrobacterium tumefaciens]
MGEVVKMENEVTARVLRHLDATDLALVSAGDLAVKEFPPLRSDQVSTFSTFLDLKQARKSKPSSELSRSANPSGIAASVSNAKRAITKLGIRLKFDTFHMRLEVEGYDKPLGETFSDIVLKLREVVIERFDFDPGQRNMEDAAQLLAMHNAFDPVRDYLEELKWDGVPRLDTWLSRYLGATDDELNRAIGCAVLVAGVRRVRRPGCKFDFMLVLEGPQGGGKSSALKILAGGDDYFTDAIDFLQGYKEHQELLKGKWIVEAPEMEGLGRADVRRVKQFISKTHDRARGAWARAVEDMPRRCILIGTTNDDDYLSDPTGNRRFWPVVTGMIDLAGLRDARDQLWAEAAEMEPGFADPVTIPQHLWDAATERQSARVANDPWEDLLERGLTVHAKHAEGEYRIPYTDICEKVLGLIGAREARKSDAKRVAICMRRLGWEGPKVVKWQGKPVRAYVRREVGMADD